MGERTTKAFVKDIILEAKIKDGRMICTEDDIREIMRVFMKDSRWPKGKGFPYVSIRAIPGKDGFSQCVIELKFNPVPYRESKPSKKGGWFFDEERLKDLCKRIVQASFKANTKVLVRKNVEDRRTVTF